MDELERAAIHDEGYDPDDPKVIAALDWVRAELGALVQSQYRAQPIDAAQAPFFGHGHGGRELVVNSRKSLPQTDNCSMTPTVTLAWKPMHGGYRAFRCLG